MPSRLASLSLVTAVLLPLSLHAADSKKKAAPAPKPAAPAAAPDTITFTNGDKLTGKFVREANGTVTFHSDVVGDINIGWDKIKELHSSQVMAVLEKNVTPNRREGEATLPIGTLAMAGGKVQLESASTHAQLTPIPTANAEYIVDRATLDKQLLREPSFFAAWNGSATAGLSLVQATQNQYTVTSAVALTRLVPTVNWLPARNRSQLDFNLSYGKITQPAYFDGTAVVPETITETNILHFDAERDEYLLPRFYYLGELSFDHNYAQSLQLQQIYGMGFGATVLKHPKQTLDVKGVAQYESQVFFNSTAGEDQNLIGATVAATYTATLPSKITFTQQLNYIPAFNNPRAYSANETDALTLPAWKSIGLTIGSLDTYLNDTPLTVPPTKRNSFQLTFGATYTVKSKY